MELFDTHFGYTVKTFGLLQPYFGCLSCMPVVYVIHYKLQGRLPISFWIKDSWEASHVKLVSFQKAYSISGEVGIWSYKSASGGVPSLHVWGTGTNAMCNQIAIKVFCKKILIERETSQVHLNTLIQKGSIPFEVL